MYKTRTVLNIRRIRLKESERKIIILGIIFISFNLRAPITAVGSLVNLIKNDITLTNSMAGFITTLPLIAFAILSPFVSPISIRFGYGSTMFFGLIFILLGEIIRSYTNILGLFLGTAMIGIGIAIGNVLIPSIIKLKFPGNTGKITSIYTSSMVIFAAVGAGVSIPLATGLNLGWRNALGVWTILTLVTIFIWFPQLKEQEKSSNIQTNKIKSKSSIWKSSLAWSVTLFMGIQSFLFYSLVAWLPTIIVFKGMSFAFAGNMALLFQLIGIPATLIYPIFADKLNDQKSISTVNALIYLSGMMLLLIGESSFITTLSVILLGFGMGGSISISIAFISLRSPNSKRAAELSGMSQSTGYLLAAIGPILLGYIFDISGSWNIPVIILIGFIILFLAVGLKAGDNKEIEL